LPLLNYVRQCRVLIQIIGEIITAMKLAACPKWGEIFFDATTRRQVPFSAVGIILIGNTPESVYPIIVSLCVVMEDETSEMQVEGVAAKVNSLKNRLQRLLEVVQRDYPDLIGTLPSPDGINIQKLGENGLIMTDSCNAAQKARRLMQHMIQGTTVAIDCHHHLQNVWIKALEKAISSSLRDILYDCLEKIPHELRATCVFSAIAWAWDKFFSLCANYLKGQGEHFAAWLRENKPDTPLYHVIGAQGSRHNLCLMVGPALYMNCHVCFDYASYVLRLPKKQDNILLRCLFVLMTSEEIIAQSRLFAILYISFCLPMQWLAAKTPELAKWGWGPISNGDAIDTLRLKMMDIVNDPKKKFR
jgi:hypothetical protein